MVIELRDQDVTKKVDAGHASLIGVDGAGSRSSRIACSSSGLPGDLQHLELGTDEVEQFVDILAVSSQAHRHNPGQLSAVDRWINALTRQMGRSFLRPRFFLSFLFPSCSLIIGVNCRLQLLGGAIGLKILERQFQLIDLAAPSPMTGRTGSA